jgi:hypothetical protein
MTKDEEELINDAVKSTESELPEAPASVSIKFWVKGYGLLFTVRDKTVNSLLQKTLTLIDMAEMKGWKSTWDKDPSEGGFATRPSVSYNNESHTADVCLHENAETRVSSGFKKPENKGKKYKICMACNKFLGFV